MKLLNIVLIISLVAIQFGSCNFISEEDILDKKLLLIGKKWTKVIKECAEDFSSEAELLFEFELTSETEAIIFYQYLEQDNSGNMVIYDTSETVEVRLTVSDGQELFELFFVSTTHPLPNRLLRIVYIDETVFYNNSSACIDEYR